MSTAAPIGALDNYYAGESARIARAFELTGDGRVAVGQRSELVVNMVVGLWRNLFGDEAPGFALGAIGLGWFVLGLQTGWSYNAKEEALGAVVSKPQSL